MKQMIKAVIFDQDGLMFDTERISAEAWNKAAGELGVTVRESFLCTVRGMNYEDSTRRFKEEYGNIDVDVEDLRRRKREYFTAMMQEREIPVKPGLPELLVYLKEQGYEIALATASSLDYSMENLRRAGIAEYFHHFVTGDMVKHAKPDPEIFLRTAECLGRKPEECLVLEDSLNGVRAGVEGGFVTIMVPDLTQPDEWIRQSSATVCDSLFAVKEWFGV